MNTMRNVLLTGVAAAALAAPAVASADSVVFIDGGNVVSARPDGTGRVQLTTDGGWHSPTQSDDGTIAAVKDLGPIVVMARDGRPLHTIQTAQAPSGDGGVFAPNPVELSLSPDGSKLAYSYVSLSCPVASTCGATPQRATAVTDTAATTATPKETYGYQLGVSEPDWASASRLLVGGGASIGISTLDIPTGQDGYRPWITPSADIGDPDLSRDGQHLAATYGYGDDTQILFMKTGGDPRTDAAPATPTIACNTGRDANNADPTWSPDGSAVAWQDSAGVHVNRFASLTDNGCVNASTTVLSATGSEPDWGQADPPAARYTPAANPAPAPGAQPAATPAATPAAGTPAKATIKPGRLTRRALRRGRAAVRVKVGSAGRVRIKLTSGRTTIATGHATARHAGTVRVRLSAARRRGMSQLRGRDSALVTLRFSAPGRATVRQSLAVRVR